jgi:hypothetical protein
MIMKVKKINFLLIVAIILAASCHSGPETVPTQTQIETAVTPQTVPTPPVQTVDTPPVDTKPVESNFSPTTAQYNTTLDEVRHFIADLNTIIANRNYNQWRAALSDEYFNQISSPEFLQQISEQPALKNQNIVLKTPQDYFTHVVVPSRANSHVEDIEFIDTNRVKAYTVNTNRQGEEQRLLLYDLERIGDSWKIIN